jgi:uncharacterized protein involved in exopolysaccharide biosynthesis
MRSPSLTFLQAQLFFLSLSLLAGEAKLPSELPPLIIGQTPAQEQTSSSSESTSYAPTKASSKAPLLGSWERIEALESRISVLESEIQDLKKQLSNMHTPPPSPPPGPSPLE